ncbi:M20/M25/M40 family metallo-hydrolase [Sulfidibacter corallicola]|uniref:M20/M25/M40 family metallo-hydrolase n=1 Tax=Sulfidibacter corallicola TaxID=2818388 RepID=A0A8A4TE62_SULCO|nr:M20/M25/M40 family metallo-hydrolase [Sulfidibacter corallicola]QTD47847.1 M20/M25/M40 family metallo-hydrolase [Sulfidibacter corallicola]
MGESPKRDEARIERARSFFETHRAWLIDRIDTYIKVETPTSAFDRLDELAAIVEEDLIALGAKVVREDHRPRPVVARFENGPSTRPPELLLVYHHDTVWPVGSFERTGVEGNRWYGPGIFDMKANLPIGLLCLRYFRSHAPESMSRLGLISSPDEETMGPVSRTILPRHARGARWALVFEPHMPDGGFKNRRKGVGRIQLKFRGLATHAGNHYAAGKSALRAASHFLLAAEAQTDLVAGRTVNVGLLSGGSAVNTRPGEADMSVDVRVTTADQWDAFLAFVAAYRDPDGVEIDMDVAPLLPPLEAEHEGWSALERLCAQLGQPYTRGMAGGGSDGSHLAQLGIKVLDGLGVAGAGEHATHEHILVDGLFDAFVRSLGLIEELLALPR